MPLRAVLLQDQVEPDFLGRVFGILTMISTSVMPLGMLLFGPLAEVVRIEWILLATGALMAILAPAVLVNRRLMDAGRKPEPGPPGDGMAPHLL
jgi:DHA3 family macrolide efflux protein-like MFS transporter